MEHKLIDYCVAQGIPHKLVVRGGSEVLRVMDLSQLPMSLCADFDVQGFYSPVEAESSTTVAETEAVIEPVAAETEEGE